MNRTLIAAAFAALGAAAPPAGDPAAEGGPPRTAAGVRPRVAFHGVRLGPDVAPGQGAALEQLAVGALQEHTGRFRVISRQDVAALVDQERRRQMLGCDDVTCAVQLADVLGVDYVASCELGRLGEIWVLSIALLDVRRGMAVARATRATTLEQLPATVEALADLVAAPFGGPAAPEASAATARETDDAESARPVSASVAPAAALPQIPGAAPAGPVSAVPAAVAAWDRGRQALRDGAPAQQLLRKVVEADPTVAQAHLALALDTRDETVGREALAQALAGRARLDGRDQALLDAAEACWRDGWGKAGCEAAFGQAAAARPRDAETRYQLGRARLDAGHLDGARADFAAARALDPTLGAALVGQAAAALLRGDAEAGALLDACLVEAPRATQCLEAKAALAEQAGRADDLERFARRLVSLQPDDVEGYYKLALALDCRGSTPEAVRGAFERAWARLPEQKREALRESDETILLVREGRFAEARKRLAGALRRALDKADLQTLEEGARLVAMLGTETGDRARAAKDLDALLASLPALPKDTAGLQLAVRLMTADPAKPLPAPLAAERDEAWQRGLARLAGSQNVLRRLALWVALHAADASTPARARDAAARLDELGVLPPPEATWHWAAGHVGRVRSLAGRPAEALPYLRRATGICNFDASWGMSILLAQARSRAATGDVEGAREDYRRIVERWGGAKPKSLTAAAARKELAALGRAKGPR